jgi:hypothetical protein
MGQLPVRHNHYQHQTAAVNPFFSSCILQSFIQI